MSNAIMKAPDVPFTQEQIDLATTSAVGAIETFLCSERPDLCGGGHQTSIYVEYLAELVAKNIQEEHSKNRATY